MVRRKRSHTTSAASCRLWENWACISSEVIIKDVGLELEEPCRGSSRSSSFSNLEKDAFSFRPPIMAINPG